MPRTNSGSPAMVASLVIRPLPTRSASGGSSITLTAPHSRAIWAGSLAMYTTAASTRPAQSRAGAL